MQAAPASGPTILGFDVIYIATLLSAVATFAVIIAIYAATTVKDPMARRASSSRRASSPRPTSARS
jgi:tight adherence protein C